MPSFKVADLDPNTQYKLLTGTVTPRPIALVTTLGTSGPNAAPFSFFNVLGSDPMMIMFSSGPRDGAAKDTLANIRECPEFVVHIVSYAIKDKMNVCATDYPIGVNEIAEAGFTQLPSSLVRPPRIAEAPIAMECKLIKSVEVGNKPHTLIIGQIVYLHYHEGIVNERFHIDIGKVDPRGRMAGAGGYVRATDRFEMPRLKYQGTRSGG